MHTVIVYGPQMSGKTELAPKLAAHFNCKNVVDDWDGYALLPPNALVITNVYPPYDISAGADVVVSIDDARLILKGAAL